MKNKQTLKLRITRLYYTIKGWNIERKMVVGNYYSTEHIPNSRFMYRGKRTFYRAYAKYVCPGVVFESQEKKVYKHWEIGVLDFKRG